MNKTKRKLQSATSTVHATISKMPPLRNLTPEMSEKVKRDMLKACQRVAKTHGLIVEGVN